MIDYEKLKNNVKELLKNDSSGHDFEHTMRVYHNAVLISNSMIDIVVDEDVVKISALLHDIAYSKEFFSDEHGDVSAELAKPIVDELELNKKQKEVVLQAISLHNFWLHNEKNVPIEIKILRDADKLDALGYTGILRAISYAANAKKDYVEVLKNQLTLKDKFETKKGKELSKSRIVVIKNFINNLVDDIEKFS